MDVIVSHVNADFDSLGGLVGAGRLYPGAAMVLPGGQQAPVAEFLALHRGVLPVRVPSEVDPQTITRVIVVDTCSRRRLGQAAAWLDLPNVELHLYDHHLETACDLSPHFQRTEAWGSVSTLMALCLRDEGEKPTPVEATVLLLGIYADTNFLSNAGTKPEDLEAAAWLLRAGGDLNVVEEFTRHSLSPEQRALLAEILAHVELHEIRGVSVAVSTPPPGPHVEGAALLVHRLLEAEETTAAFVLAEMEGALYVIGRSTSDRVNVGAALKELGGGGHARAASATLKGEAADAVRERLLTALARHLAPEPKAKRIMSSPVRTISPEATVAEARRRMVRYGHSGLVVMERGKLAGVVTRRDVDKARHHHLEHAPVRGFMTPDVHTADLSTPLSELEGTLIGENIGRLPVVHDGEVVGIVTRRDVLKARFGARYLRGAPHLGEDEVSQLVRERLPAEVQRLLEQVGQVAAREGWTAYAVGGFVRDLLLDVRNLDVDLVVEPDGVALARAFAEETGGQVKVEERFGTARVKLPDGFEVDFATARTETYAHPGALPEVEPSSVVDDLRRRDFTLNAMAIELQPERFGELLDPFGGRRDLDYRRLRVLHPLSFREDPTRVFRAVRFEERFHFRMDRHTESLARDALNGDVLDRISPERVRAELYRTFREHRPLGALLRLGELGALEWLHPELRPDERLIQALPGALDWWASEGEGGVDAALVYLAALLAPLGPETGQETAARRLRVPPPDLRKVAEALQARARPDTLLPEGADPATLTRLLKPLPPEAVVLLRAAAVASGDGEAARKLLDRFLREWRHTKLEITGEDLKALGYRPGAALGDALRATLDAKLNGEVSGREEELERARARIEARGEGEDRPARSGAG
jgi:tRNA nucleotidyltransferase (CCA-adding enzyme)